MQSNQLIPFLSIFLFLTGIIIVLTKRNNILILLGIELMFNAANVHLVYVGQSHANFEISGMILFTLLVAVCETAVALAIIIEAYRFFKSSEIRDFDSLKN